MSDQKIEHAGGLKHDGAVQIVTPVDERDQRLAIRVRCLEIAASQHKLGGQDADGIIATARQFESYVYSE